MAVPRPIEQFQLGGRALPPCAAPLAWRVLQMDIRGGNAIAAFMKLYGSYNSPFARHCRVALIQAGLPWEFVETDATGAAKRSPTQKVPFLEDGDLKLTDSSSILKHIRDRSAAPFLSTVSSLERYCMVNTALDACVNIFLLERYDRLRVSDSAYLTRQQARITSTFRELEAGPLPTALPLGDDDLRLACFLDWALFRKRIDLDEFPSLMALLSLAREDQAFAATAPVP